MRPLCAKVHKKHELSREPYPGEKCTVGAAREHFHHVQALTYISMNGPGTLWTFHTL